MHKQLYFSYCNLLSNWQSEFRKGLATTHALINWVEKSIKAFNEYVGLVLCDLTIDIHWLCPSRYYIEQTWILWHWEWSYTHK